MESAATPKPLGDILVEKGVVSRADLDRCAERQRTLAREGRFVRLGEVLVEQGILTLDEVQRALSEQDLTILACGKCQAQFNVHAYDAAEVLDCQRCGAPLFKPKSVEKIVVEDTLKESRKSGRNLGLDGALTQDPTKGMAWFGPYEILGEISRGGMSAVYRARQPKLDRIVALKVLLDRSSAKADTLGAFYREARAVSRLRHPNIVAIFEVGRIDDVEFFTMDYLEGVTLEQAVVLENLGPREVAEIFLKVAEALDYAHRKNVLHRDIKPRNIVLERGGEPIIIDFGIAQLLDAKEESGDLAGSPAYMAPEYLQGTCAYDACCEVYALGVSLYQLLSGRRPDSDGDTQALIRNAANRVFPPLHRVASSVPKELSQIVMTALSSDRKRRYLNPGQMARDLQRFLNGEEVDAQTSELYRSWRRVRVKAAVVAAGAVSLFLVFSSGYYARTLSDQSRDIRALDTELSELRRIHIETYLNHIELLLEIGRAERARILAKKFFKRFPEAQTGRGLELQARLGSR